MRHVPFGADWDMPVEVSVSEWVVAAGTGWSCGQCPLDAQGAVVAPGDVEAQARLVSRRIAAGLGRAGLAAGGVLALVVYGTDPLRSAALLRDGLPLDLPVLPVAVPALYYAGMTLEVDVIAAADGPVERHTRHGRGVAAAPGLTAVSWVCEAGDSMPGPDALAAHAGRVGDAPLASMLALPAGLAAPAGWPSSSVRRVPPGGPAAALLLFGKGSAAPGRSGGDATFIETAEAGELLRITAWCPDPDRALGAQAEAAMAALIGTLAGQGLGPQALVKVTAHHLGEDSTALHESLAARHRHHVRPGPASTGLGVAGLGPDGAAVVIEAIAAR